MEFQTLDTLFLGTKAAVGAFLMNTQEGPALFETGPASSLEGLKSALLGAGVPPKDVRHVFLTHVHLDHAGAAWWFAEHGAKVYAHPKAASHLVQPGRLWSSVKRLYGGMAEELWGEIRPIPEDRVKILQDKERVSLGDVQIVALDTPGHAVHHLAYFIDGAIVCGDIGGVRYGQEGPAVPPCPPPDINVEDWARSIDTLAALNPSVLFLTHFGPFTDTKEHLASLKDRLLRFERFIQKGLEDGLDPDTLKERFENAFKQEFHALGLDEAVCTLYERINPAWTNVLGLVRYLQKKKVEGGQLKDV